MAIEENEVRQLLGLDDEGDILATIQGLHTQITELKTAVKDTNPPGKEELRELRKELAESEKRLIAKENEMSKQIIELQEENRREKAERMVDSAITAGRVQPSLREMALKLAYRDPKDFEEFAAKLPGVDLKEHGVATDAQMADLEPTRAEIEVAQQLGVWNEEYRIKLVRQKAAAKGIQLPAEPDKK